MSIETLESSDTSFPTESVFLEEPSSIWHGREVHILEKEDTKIRDQKERMYSSFIQEDRTQQPPHNMQMTRFAHPVPKSWNFESFPIPPTKPILAPVPDPQTCEKYARGFRKQMLEELQENFLKKNLISESDYYQIERILDMLVDEVYNQTRMLPLYKIEVNWKEVLQPLNRLFQFWHRKWELYGIPPSPNDHPLPEF